MSKVAIFYASQNGSTQEVAKRMRTTFLQEGEEVDLFKVNLNNKLKLNLDAYDLIGIGTPTYIYRPSYEIIDFLNSLENFKNKKVFTFVTYGTEIGDGAKWLQRKIKRMGAIDIGNFSCTGKNLFPGYTHLGYFFSPEGPTENELNAADSFIKSLISRLETNHYPNSLEHHSQIHPVYRFERFVTNRFFIENFYRFFFKTDKSRCTKCECCLQSCPTNNIAINKINNLSWGRNCILCLKCEMGCPHKAIITPLSWLVFLPFFRWNIRKAVKNNIPYQKRTW